MYNSSMFATRKDIHIKIRTENWEQFRAELMKRRLSMQEVFDEVAAMIAREESAALKMLDKIVYNKAREKMERLLRSDTKPTEHQERVLGKNTPEVVPARDKETFLDLLERVTPLDKESDS